MKKSGFIGIVMALVLALVLTGCDEQSAQTDERATQQNNYERLAENQPAEAVNWSPTRDTVNAWSRAWGQEPGKLSYVFLKAANGQNIGYFVLKGLPVSYCALLTPDYRFERWGGSHWKVKAPSIDGVYYSGGQCDQYYGVDAETGAYIEFSIGDGISYLLFDQPRSLPDAQPLGYTVINDDGSLGTTPDAPAPVNTE